MPTPRRTRAVRSAFAVLALVAALALAACSSSSSPHRPHAAGVYLALGDSLAFGYQPATVLAPNAYSDATNFTGYPELIADDRKLALTNASCPGETTQSMIDAGKLDNGCSATAGAGTTGGGYRTKYPLHTTYSGAQLDYAVSFLKHHKNTSLVTLDIGLNDVLVCYRVTTSKCTGSAVTTQLHETTANLSTIFTTLRGKGGYQGAIVWLTSYPEDYSSPAQVAVDQTLNDALVTVAKKYKAVVADGYGAFKQASVAYGGDACKAGLLILQPSGSCDYHPSDRGQQVLADAVEKVLPKGSY